MADVRIDNPVLNSAFAEPFRHHELGDEGVTGRVVEGRRSSTYFVPIPKAKRSSATQLSFEEEQEKRENEFINAVRAKVRRWREDGRPHLTATSRMLLDQWTDPGRERKLFFCQIEALETAMYLREAAPHDTGTRFDEELAGFAESHNPGLFRMAFKMATGSGKTVVMAMLIAWQTLNKIDNPHDTRWANAFLVVTPGITIRERLQVLQPQAPNNYYDEMRLLTPDQRSRLFRAEIVIVNFHQFQLRERDVAGGRPTRLGKAILGRGAEGAFRETNEQMVARICGPFRGRGEIVVLNDEAHHCYQARTPDPDDDVPKLKGDELREAKEDTETARVWAEGLQQIGLRHGIKAVYDLSATPFFLNGSGYPPGQLFPWVVSDFALVDAIESGIVKVPQVPVDDDAVAGDGPRYRVLWPSIRDELPKKAPQGEEPRLPQELEGALVSLYGSYRKTFERWQERADVTGREFIPPVFIVVANNTATSKVVFDWIAGYEREVEAADGDGGDGDEEPTTVLVEGKLDLFSNVERSGSASTETEWRERPNTVLIDSRQLESGEAMSTAFKKAAATEIEAYKRELIDSNRAADAERLTDEDLLREVMNTVGQPGRLGGQVRCVVSVSMLTEGWDARTVTHILGVRAFGTQLLCEQVVGRGLRRRSYDADDQGRFEAEYAQIYGVPFQFLPTSGTDRPPVDPADVVSVYAVPERRDLAIEFPHVVGYRYEFPEAPIDADLSDVRPLVLDTTDVPSSTEVKGIVGEGETHDLDWLVRQRRQRVEFEVAAEVLRRFNEDSGDRPHLFPQVLDITRRFVDECVQLKDKACIQLLLLTEQRDLAAERLMGALTQAGSGGFEMVRPVLRDFEPVGSSFDVDFETSRPTWETSPDRCPVNRVTLDSGWEEDVARRIEEADGVRSYVKNDHLYLRIPYTHAGRHRHYEPDFLVSLHVPDGAPPATVVAEVSGEDREDKAAKTAAARDLWVPAVNNHGGFGRWSFVEITDPTDVIGPLAEAMERALHAHPERI